MPCFRLMHLPHQEQAEAHQKNQRRGVQQINTQSPLRTS